MLTSSEAFDALIPPRHPLTEATGENFRSVDAVLRSMPLPFGSVDPHDDLGRDHLSSAAVLSADSTPTRRPVIACTRPNLPEVR